VTITLKGANNNFMYDYQPQMLKETLDAKRSEMMREAESERLAKRMFARPRGSLFEHLRSLLTKMLSL